LLQEEAAGDPMTRQKWVRLSLVRLQDLLAQRGHRLDAWTIRRLMRKLGYSLKANRKRLTGPRHPDRDRQFRYIARLKKQFFRAGWPVISVDSKKKELVGNFKNAGQVWCQQAEEVNAHDFPQDAVAKATPYGIYLPQLDRGYVYVGVSRDTPAFAVDAISRWWRGHGRWLYPEAKRLLILADSGGSNGCRPRLWKFRLQQLAEREQLTITVCHYPRGASKWNPVEHRLLSFISINWAGKPLRTLEIMLGYISDTETETGLRVQAVLLPGLYKTGVKVSKREWKTMRLHQHQVCPNWNYSRHPLK
jgi:Rhodopirellula transposase DDE domain